MADPLATTAESGSWFADERGAERRMRVSWHRDRHLFVLSIWQRDRCTATFQLPVDEVPRFVAMLVGALGAAVAGSTSRPRLGHRRAGGRGGRGPGLRRR